MPKALRVIEQPFPTHVPTQETRDMVCRMAACGLNDVEVSFALAIPLNEVRRWYTGELSQGLAVITAKVGGALIDAALRGDTNAAAFFLRSRARWTTPTKASADDTANGPSEVAAREKLMQSILAAVQKAEAVPAAKSQATPAAGTLQ